MRHEFLDTGDYPLRKIQADIAGLRYAVFHDGSVTWKLILSVVLVVAAFGARA